MDFFAEVDRDVVVERLPLRVPCDPAVLEEDDRAAEPLAGEVALDRARVGAGVRVAMIATVDPAVPQFTFFSPDTRIPFPPPLPNPHGGTLSTHRRSFLTPTTAISVRFRRLEVPRVGFGNPLAQSDLGLPPQRR